MSYSTKKITTSLIDELKNALHKVDYGSIEIFVQDNTVTQITIRNIKKTSYKLEHQMPTISPSSRITHLTDKATQKIRVLTLKKE